ncbi:YecR family lipoprotein [Aromatoleum evansii]|uniref:YecR family lipoprotein n=1 Tax=Aromatoleum evansii TaxID=59406 RepID=A0ABZ1AI14_AROEV|nr:YecR family lipoprotein [Aromatoleum evansii]
MTKILAALALAALLSGCAVTRDWSATGGSRADGVVRLAYESHEMEDVRVSEAQAVKLAAQRCKTWGYSGAEAFGGVTRQCTKFGGFSGCSQWTVTKEFQCTGTGTATETSAPAPAATPTPTPTPPPAQNANSAPSRLIQDARGAPVYTLGSSAGAADQKEAENARVAVASSGCQPTKLPVRFKQQHDTNFYEARCTDGRLVHALCTFGDCRLRTRED